MNLLDRIKDIVDLPTIPTTLTRILEITGREDSSVADLAKVVMVDQALAAKLLRVANSPLYGLPRQINAIDRAITMLGFIEVRNLALSMTVFESLYMPSSQVGEFSRSTFWEHSFIVAHASRTLAREMRLEGGNAFTAGLLHDIGKVFLDLKIPALFTRIVEMVAAEKSTFYAVESRVLGTAHDEIGAYLLDSWNLPNELVKAVRHHHRPVYGGPVAVVVYFANLLAQAAGFPCMEKWPEVALDDLLKTDEVATLKPRGLLPSEALLRRTYDHLQLEGEKLSAQAALLI